MRSDRFSPIRFPKFWVIYFLLSAVLSLIPPLGDDVTAASLASYALGLASLYPLYGYVWNRNFGYQRFWRVIFWVMTVLLFVYLWVVLLILAAHPEAWASIASAMFCVVVLPKLYALWYYSNSNLNANA